MSRFLPNLLRLPVSSLALALSLAAPASVGAQGALTPTGAPAPSGRSLDQVEPRIPIPASGPFPYNITQRGSYFLTGNVTVASGNAIVIQASDVQLDLSGFTISSSSTTLSGRGVLLDTGASNNVSIGNGFIRGTTTYNSVNNTYSGGGFAEAVGSTLQSSFAPNGIRVSSLGVAGVGDGIQLNPTSPANVVERVTVANVQGVGIRAGVVADSSADRTGGVSIESRSASNVAGSRTTPGDAVLPAPVAPLVRADLEPRTALAGGTSTLTIASPGSYFLAGNLTVSAGDGIVINADNVTLDLNGYTISSTAGTPGGQGVSLAGGRTNVSVFNGHIRGTRTFSAGSFSGGGFASGVDYVTSAPRSVRVTNVSVTGVGSYGIDLGTDRASAIAFCTVRTAGILGLRAGSIADSAALEVGGSNAISAATVANVYGSLTGAGTAVVATEPTLASLTTQVTNVQSAITAIGTTTTSTQTTLNAVQTTLNAVQTTVNTVNTATAATQSGVTSLQNAADTRTALAGSSSTVTISQPGSYVLKGNVVVSSGNGIVVNASDVTLDLNGFRVVGVVGGGTGILINGTRNVTIRNGMVVGGATFDGTSFAGSGFTAGVSPVFSSLNMVIEQVSVSNIRGVGIQGFDLVRHCVVSVADGDGIVGGSIYDSRAENCAVRGVAATDLASGCTGISVGSGSGVSGAAVLNCVGRSEAASGIAAFNMATNCLGYTASASSSHAGVDTDIASQCTGYSSQVGSVGLRSRIAVASRGVRTQLNTTSESITNKYLMP